VSGGSEAKSCILGGLAAFVPNFFFGIRIYKSLGRQPKEMLNAFYIGEAGKFLLTLVLFVVIFQLPDIKILPLLVSYVAALSVFWFALLMR
jgi:ATP synthase protein I